MLARSYNDKQLDTLSRSIFYDALKYANSVLNEKSPDDEKLHACATVLDAAACGVQWAAGEDDDADIPAGMRQLSPYNDDLLNEQARDVYVRAMTFVQAYLQGSVPMNTEKMIAYAHVADAAASGFHEDEDDD